MLLVNANPEFTNNPYLTTPIERHLVETLPFKDFDKDGYEVPTPLEHLHYEINNVELNRKIQFHIAPVQEWYYDIEQSEHGLVLDHCMLLTRYAFGGEAREQIKEVCKNRPILQKLLNIKPKWGIDFSLDYIYPGGCMELFHIEADYWTYEEALEGKWKAEELIMNADWEDQAETVLKKKDQWIDLNADDQADWKAQYFGWDRAFDNFKVFS